jgi:ribonuclease HI
MQQSITIYCDGLVEPINPGGYACWAWIAYGPKGSVLNQNMGCLGHGPGMTNNLSEYRAVIEALQHAESKIELLTERGLSLTIRSDSKLVIEQLSGRWRVGSPNLIPLHAAALTIIESFQQLGVPVALEWIPREQNMTADNLTRQAYADARRQSMRTAR